MFLLIIQTYFSIHAFLVQNSVNDRLLVVDQKKSIIAFPVLIKETTPHHMSRRYLTRPEAATIIQRAYRKYKKRKLMKALLVDPAKKNKTVTVFKKTKRGVLSMFNTMKNHFESDLKHNCDLWNSFSRRNLLEDGTLFHEIREVVLVFGGLDPHNPYGFGKNTGTAIYRYMPVGNCWELVGELPEPRHHHCAEFYKGKIFLAGGGDPRGSKIFHDAAITNSMWSFDPVTRKWFKEEPMTKIRKNFGLIGCSQGLYAIGGQGEQHNILNHVERYDVESKIWCSMQPMFAARTGFACTKFRNHIWVAGGISGNDNAIDILDSVEIYDIRSNQWNQLKIPLRIPRCFSSLFVLSDKLYIIGGAGKPLEKTKETSTTSIGSVDVWNDKRFEWKEVANMNIARHGHAVSHLGTQILIVGGVTTAYGRALSSTECFCSQREAWVRGLACLPTPLAGHSVVTLPPASLLTF